MTSYEVIYEMFFRRVEKDKKFFSYVGLTDAQAMQLARERANGYFEEALAVLTMKGRPSVDFTDRDRAAAQFNFDLTAQEKYIVSSLMYQQYLERDIAYLKTLSVNYTSTDLRVFDPSNARSTFMTMFNAIKGECEEMLDIYRNTDRTSGDFIGIDFESYDTEE